MTIHVGDVIDGKYEIVRLIGEGGMGAVYEARNLLISRTVALKVLLASAIENDPKAAQRFQREAQAAGRIGCDHIMEVIDLGALSSGERYLVMEYLDGETLAARIKRLGRLSPQELHPLLTQALLGLAAAHRAEIIHRDLKPDNLFILREKAGQPDFVKLIDFGISKFNDGPPSEMSMTQTGALMGTPYYMSPEQAKGAGGVTHQTDIYSLGVIAFEAVTGQVPYDGDTFNELMFKIVLSDLPDPTRLVTGVDPAFAAIIRKAMARNLEERFASATTFLAALERWSPTHDTMLRGSGAADDMTGPGGLETVSQEPGSARTEQAGARARARVALDEAPQRNARNASSTTEAQAAAKDPGGGNPGAALTHAETEHGEVTMASEGAPPPRVRATHPGDTLKLEAGAEPLPLRRRSRVLSLALCVGALAAAAYLLFPATEVPEAEQEAETSQVPSTDGAESPVLVPPISAPEDDRAPAFAPTAPLPSPPVAPARPSVAPPPDLPEEARLDPVPAAPKPPRHRTPPAPVAPQPASPPKPRPRTPKSPPVKAFPEQPRPASAPPPPAAASAPTPPPKPDPQQDFGY